MTSNSPRKWTQVTLLAVWDAALAGSSRYVETALTLQTSLGFLLTLFTIRRIPPLVDRFGWDKAFVVLAVVPAFGI